MKWVLFIIFFISLNSNLYAGKIYSRPKQPYNKIDKLRLNSSDDSEEKDIEISLQKIFINIMNENITQKNKISLMKEKYSENTNYITCADDFIDLLKHIVNKNSPKNMKLCMDDFIRNSLKIFQELNPDIDDVMGLHTYILSIQVNLETTVATLIKLKETFMYSFSGSDLIRLLSYGCEYPAQQYKNQLNMLKKNLDSNIKN